MSDSRISCSDCAFYNETRVSLRIPLEEGECRFYPPKKSIMREGKTYGIYVTVNGKDDWCSKLQDKNDDGT